MQDLSLFILDIVQNSVRAEAAHIGIHLAEDKKKSTLRLRVEDDGAGMNPSVSEKALDPFFTTRTTRSVGLGLSFLKAAAESTGGFFSLNSVEGQGTTVEALFHTDHVDMVPLGDLAATFLSLLSAREQHHLDIHCQSGSKEFSFNTETVESVLEEELRLSVPELYLWCSETLTQGIQDVFGSRPHFIPDLDSF